MGNPGSTHLPVPSHCPVPCSLESAGLATVESLTTRDRGQIPAKLSATVQGVVKISKYVRKTSQEIHGQDDRALELLDRDISHYDGHAPVNNQKCGGDGNELSLCKGTDRVNKN